jgi:pimeloyl-ACP methyl ester carboxylesterase
MAQIVFVHGMFQNPKSWRKWEQFFQQKGFECMAPAWPLHDGEPRELRANPPENLGQLTLDDVIASIKAAIAPLGRPIMIGHSVGGLVTQLLLNQGLVAAGIGIDSVAPNAMLDLDWGFLKNSAIIANPFKGDDPVLMDARTFHSAFANTLNEADAATAFDAFATHDSRNVLRDCMGTSGEINLTRPHNPLLLIGGEKDEIIPASLSEKNARAYSDKQSITAYKEFKGRSHYICGEPGWEEVAGYIADWLKDQRF